MTDKLLAASVVFPNVKLTSGAAFQPLALPIIAFDLIRTGRFRASVGSFLVAYGLAIAIVLIVTQRFDGTSFLYIVLFLSGPVTCLYLLNFEWASASRIVEFGLVLVTVSSFEQVLVGSAAVERIWATVFAIRPDAIGLGTRGVPGFTSEPSHAGRLFAMLLAIAAFTKMRRWRFWAVIAPVFLIVNRSAFGFFLVVPLLVAMVWRKSRAAAVLLTVLALASLQVLPESDVRFFEVVTRSLSAIRSDQNIILRLGEAGGRRAIDSFVSVVAMVDRPTGYGLGANDSELRTVSAALGYDLSIWPFYRFNDLSGKPSSYLAQLMFDCGLFAIVPIIAFLRQLRRYRIHEDVIARVAFWSGVLQVVAFSTTTIPWPWALIAMGLTSVKKPTADSR